MEHYIEEAKQHLWNDAELDECVEQYLRGLGLTDAELIQEERAILVGSAKGETRDDGPSRAVLQASLRMAAERWGRPTTATAEPASATADLSAAPEPIDEPMIPASPLRPLRTIDWLVATVNLWACMLDRIS